MERPHPLETHTRIDRVEIECEKHISHFVGVEPFYFVFDFMLTGPSDHTDCRVLHSDDVRPDDELLLGGVLHALPNLEREDNQTEGEEAARQHQPHHRLLARREQQLHVPLVALVVRRGQHDQARVGHDRLGELSGRQ